MHALWSSRLPAQAAIKVLATTADWGALAAELGGDKVNVYTATNALQDVHRVDAKPSLVARARSADLLVANGAELEIGWLPVLLQESGNSQYPAGRARILRSDLGAASARHPDVPSIVRWVTFILWGIHTCTWIRATSHSLRRR